MHWPAWQVLPAAQGLSQPPQCWLLVMVSAHIAPHVVWLAAQPHMPAEHAAPPLQALSQLPQWPMSVFTSTQAPLQLV
jgi:hypothetical protein